MKKISEDHRARITKSLIKSAFLELLQEKNIRHISIRELCEKAQISRSTFYAHYVDIYEVKEQLENELLEALKTAYRDALKKNGGNLLSAEIFEAAFRLLHENSELCTILLNSGQDIVDKYIKISEEIFMPLYQAYFASATEIQLKNYFLFTSGGSIAILKNWLTNHPDVSAKKVAAFVSDLIQKGVAALL